MSRGWDGIRIVTAPEELEEIYRFRYRIYVEEMHRPQADADHERKRIEDKLDKSAYNIAAFKDGRVVGVVRVNFSRDGDIGEYADFYRMSGVGTDHPRATSIVTRLMIEPKLRSGTLAAQLSCHCYELGIRNQIRWCFIDCNEHLVAFFSALGCTAYMGRVEHPEYGFVTPMRFDCLDTKHLATVRSPFQKILRKFLASAVHGKSGEARSMDTNMSHLDARAEMQFAFLAVMEKFLCTPAMKTIRSGSVTKQHYGSALREIYHYTKEDPQIQAYATAFLRGSDRGFVEPFLCHATSEVGHEMLALNDLATLGEDIDGVEKTLPLPSTVALTAFAFYQITFGNPISYLGYLYFLEFLPTQHGDIFRIALQGADVPAEAFTFLGDHMKVDMGHNQLMEKYLAQLVRNRADLDAVIYTMRVTADLYAKMLEGAFARAEHPCDYGTAWEEVARLRPVSSATVNGPSVGAGSQ